VTEFRSDGLGCVYRGRPHGGPDQAREVVADIVGHEKTTMTYGLYSGGVSLAVKRDALEKLAY